MIKKRYTGCVLSLATILCMTAAAQSQQPPKTGKKQVFVINKWNKEFNFKGKVESVDLNRKTVVVTGDAIPGWKFSMTASYTVDNPEVLTTLMPGDLVTAQVHEGDFKVLYGLRLAPPEDTPAFFPKKQ